MVTARSPDRFAWCDDRIHYKLWDGFANHAVPGTGTDAIMRIAHFIQRYPPALGGSEAYFARLSRYCAQRGDDVTVFTTTAIALEAFWNRQASCVPADVCCEAGVTLRRYGLWRCPGRRYLLKALSLVPHRRWQCLTLPCNPICPAMWRNCGSEPLAFDVVHAAAFPYAWPIACGLRLARRLAVPFLLTPFLHLGDPDDPRDPTRRGYLMPALRWLLRQADGLFVQTPSERDALLTLGIPAARVHLQGLGVDPAECTGGDRQAARQCWGVDGDAFVVGHLANNSREKGTIDLLLAAERMRQRGMDVRVVLAGPEMPNFRAFWQDVGERQAQRVVRLGPLSDEQKRDFFAGIDVFALPSRSDSFGLVLLEAWANGVPNVAYRAGGIADVIRPGIDGLLAPCGDVEQLATALTQMHDDAAMRQSLGASGRGRLLTEFCWGDKLQLVRGAYEDAARHAGNRKRRPQRSHSAA
jgi:glycosyltransferase involved in cell wall biosynthesis